MKTRVFYWLGIICEKLHLYDGYQYFMQRSVEADSDCSLWTDIEDEDET